ncbi:Glu/Leu/Phe/Val dehydrogenase [Rhodococcus sp. NPDC057529]|uniref:Glu/Leu/Phe/Val family dehydrogenase n=1 Tax=Rhodococcus sp. NPDC057529 TaxID=3346158 RepID=UPI00366BED11
MSVTADVHDITNDPAVFDRADAIPGFPHEQVVFCEDAVTGLRAIIGIHSTVLGPALGGTRFYPYPDQGSALTDVLRLSRGMTYKAAVAGVSLGGGKAVIIGNPAEKKTPALLRAYGRFIETLGGRYISAGDVGTGTFDLDIIGEATDHVVGRSASAGGSGDSGPMTALGVYQGMRAAATVAWGEPTLKDRVVGVEGVGKVGSELISLLVADGARVVATDVSRDALALVADRFPGVTTTGDVLAERLDVYAPCALGGTLNEKSLGRLAASIVCGAANNQLLEPGIDTQLHDRGVIWVPDYVANAGGLIQVAGERDGATVDEVRGRVDAIHETVIAIFDRSVAESIAPGRAADRMAEGRLDAARVR